MKKFYDSIGYLTKWCSYNKVDINWNKSEIMFITNKQNITIPEFINISGNNVKVVTEFKLLGIIIDNKLNFKSNTAKIKRSINIRLYSIQKLFQLPLAVKIQFLKTFILPYFDYCATLCICYSKSILQKLANSYNNCIFKIINVKSVHDSIINSSEDFNKWNTLLEQYGLNGFQHRLIIRLATYIQNVFFDLGANIGDSAENFLSVLDKAISENDIKKVVLANKLKENWIMYLIEGNSKFDQSLLNLKNKYSNKQH